MSLEAARLAARAHVIALDEPGCAKGPPEPTEGAWRRRIDGLVTFLFFPFVGVLGKDIFEAVRELNPASTRIFRFCLLALWWIYAAPFVILAFLAVRIVEFIEPDHEPEAAPESKLLRLELVEDARTKNELTVWFPVKPTIVGRLLMRVILFGSERGTRHLWTKGKLAGAENIHYARLLLADGGRHMLFLSDYEGSFDAYIDHFIGLAGNSRAVIPISSRVHGCPKTRWLYLPHAQPAEFRRRWRAMVRSYQLQASVRYVAYPDLSANDILNHSLLRERLFAADLTSMELAEWARGI
jgi:hypothetical protein